MKHKLLKIFMVCFFCTASMAFAQNRTVTGTVTAKDDGLPIPGVTVKIKGTTTGAQTNATGKYTLSVPTGSTLVFSFIGYVSIEKPAADVVNVVLVPASNQLNEVVVTALNISREAKTIGYSSSTLKSEDLTKARDANVLNSMAGKVAGVRINSQSGTLGGSTKIVIRGVNSFNGNSPLFVIDGLTVSDNTSSGGTVANNVDFGNRMGDLSSDDIESMTVLKGAAATALYGSRALDGAVIITTKKGKKGTFSVDINSSVRFDNPLVLPKFQNEYAQGNQGVYANTQLNGWGPKITGQSVNQFPNFTAGSPQTPLVAYPDNVKDFFQTGVSAINNISFGGGDEKSDYRVSFSSANEKGIIPESSLDRYTLAVNTGRNFSDKLSSRFSGSYTNIVSDGRPAQSANNQNAIINSVYGLPRTVDINALKNNVVDPVTGVQQFLAPGRLGNNPYWIMDYNRNSNSVDRFTGTYNLTYKPVTWVTLSNTFGADIYTEKRSLILRKGTAGYLPGQFTKYDLLSKQVNDDFLATFEQNNLVKDFKFKLLVGGNINQRFNQTNQVDAFNLTIDQLYTYSNAASSTATLGYQKRRLLGLYGDLSIGYKDYLFLDVTGRNDWTSTLPVDSRSYFYPSVSGSFVFSEVLKDKGFDWLSFGKLRASWASVGSDLGPYQLDYQYSPTSTVFLQYVDANAIVFPAGPIATAFAAPRTLPNSTLKPQKENSYEFGTELKFLNNRIGLDFTYYHSNIKNQLISITVPPSTGYFAKVVNAGVIQNSGIEATLNLVPVKLKDFEWNINVNFAKNNQKVKELLPGLNLYSVASGYSGLLIQAEVGQSLGLYGGQFSRSPDGQYIIDPTSGLRVVTQGKRLGSIYADWTGGLNNTFRYKGFSLSSLIDIRKGGVFFSGTVSGLRTSGLAAETGGDRSQLIVDKGVNLVNGAYVPNTKAINAQNYWSWIGSTTNTEGSVFDAGFIKLREVQFAYQLPSKLFKASFVKGIQIGVEGRNLWLIKSHVPHVDPELNFFGSGSVGEGVEFNSIPSTRTIGMNLRVSL
ncbi:TonB-linked outer membrane protein, SusC/RagA family [Mucilaginibacter lappiensis]|uniref:TonB-linked SusC/RagA family outer membrane protein n=1 Tax=Mucilaginibacter lappiensis TaxID=354630 RepID=A0ABR6PGM0_9SPHI|nr:SusC/RagA family TonB-linked outer membrane protein [Mucilaginibacter lappiensis]MBB6108816.1 TonB-linked SusC/RagA family outer membrane protein [Mucilaginibacter lappiensis]SIQ63370.1 TonB-linked outer membrane protein, SusC/RagA family [Mucilaginibacter lappiensis]